MYTYSTALNSSRRRERERGGGREGGREEEAPACICCKPKALYGNSRSAKRLDLRVWRMAAEGKTREGVLYAKLWDFGSVG